MSTVLVYSDDPETRERVMLAVGRRPDPESDPIELARGRRRRGRHPAVDSGTSICAFSTVKPGRPVAWG